MKALVTVVKLQGMCVASAPGIVNWHFWCIPVSSNPLETEGEEPKEDRVYPTGFDGGHGAQGLGWEPGVQQSPLLRLLAIQRGCVRGVRA